ncbi:Hypothetical predicted protein [Podarcis lilfordi]|uniref:Carboxypeptidase inhibitor n=1 Tax=Podarcis lilfordi TaxID=74358 RepID=A0AA35P3D1_9SAUR|nr:Hypothetical predicted protein [Podarcis lilfordi]
MEKAHGFLFVLLCLGTLRESSFVYGYVKPTHIDHQECLKKGGRCLGRTSCEEQFVFYGHCQNGSRGICCKRDPEEYCKWRGGACTKNKCPPDSSSLHKCTKRVFCCRKRPK